MNIKVFPWGYCKGLSYPIKSLSFFGEVRKGVTSGAARVVVNNRTVCHTNFQDLIEIIQTSKHPVGRDNHITTDKAWLNCLLGAMSLVCLIAAIFGSDIENKKIERALKPLLFSLSAILYVAQLIEGCLSSTTAFLWRSPAWEDFSMFKMWFFELKKFRPVIHYSYTPSTEQRRVLQTTLFLEKQLQHFMLLLI